MLVIVKLLSPAKLTVVVPLITFDAPSALIVEPFTLTTLPVTTLSWASATVAFTLFKLTVIPSE